ncbi:AMP-binding protein [Edaphobacter bradus]|uniref:AMP-binding protein n=1 Tax=Edaphobacter bradus TaxID=2259016 RepID=UPI0021E014DE|nr:AMP-binding protein [Edaphobacter bradus]
MRPHIASLVDDWRASGSQTAVVRYSGNRATRTSYRQLLDLAERFATELDRRTIGSGERVVLWGQNSAEWIAVFFGCILRGVIVVPLDAAGSPEFAQRVIAETNPSLITGDTDLLRQLITSSPTLSLEGLASNIPPKPLPPTTAVILTRETPLQIVFTSGTTSEPKGVVHTHGNVLASVEPIESEIAKYRRYERPFHPLRFLHTLPLSHVFGQFMGLWLPPLLAAGVHFESRLEAERLIRAIQRERISVLAAVPRMLELLRAHLLLLQPDLDQQLTSSQDLPIWKRLLRFRRVHRLFGWKFWACICGGASLPPDLERFWSTLGFAVIQGYGMTETTALITLNHPFKIGKGTLGKPLPGREVRIGSDGEVSVRGEVVATSTWQQGAIQQRSDPWLATGDLASLDEEGQLRFVGRKSETIVTPAGLNIHPEDLETALLRQPQISACAVVPAAQQPVAVLVVPQGHAAAEQAVASANRDLADFQRIRHWYLWPAADLPRTSTGKVRRRAVADWTARQIASQTSLTENPTTADPLLALVASIASAPATKTDDTATLAEDLHLDSLGRLQLQTAIEQRFGIALSDEAFLSIETLGQLRAATTVPSTPQIQEAIATGATPKPSQIPQPPQPSEFLYPRWPWSRAIAAIRILFLELIIRPLVWLLLNPGVERPQTASLPTQPMLLISNHVTFFDAALVLYGLPLKIRQRVAIAAAGEMLEDWRHARNQPHWWQNVLAPLQYLALTALFNIFPIPRQAGFRRSFAHMGEALDCGYHVLIFPEGRQSLNATLLPFRSGIGLLAYESNTAVLPIAIKGLDDLVSRKRRWFHAGLNTVRIGAPIRLDPSLSAEEATVALHEIMQKLLQ